MIPPHRSSFGIGTIIGSCLANPESRRLDQLEAAYATAAGCPSAVWLPSARAGICWALRASIGPQTKVLGPAFTCSVVHEAIVRSGGAIHLIDAAKEGFLMNEETLFPAQSGKYAIVLTEPFGHTYDLAQVTRNAISPPLVRIVDMAMSVPHPALFERLEPRDFALLSFGSTSKPMFAGWGAMGFARDPALGNEVRQLRDSTLAKTDSKMRLRRMAEVFLRTLAHYPQVYSLVRRLRPELAPATLPETPWVGFPASWAAGCSSAPEWNLPSTLLDRSLAQWNLEHVASLHQARITLARRYHSNLHAAKFVIRPKTSPYALSHYTICLSPALRLQAQRRLHQSGIYALTLWAHHQPLDKNQFPNAFGLKSSILNLPLSPQMSDRDVDLICSALTRCLESES